MSMTEKEIIDIWKKVIDVQQHFNDIALKIRNYALTLYTAIIGGIGLLEKENIVVTVFGYDMRAAFFLSVIGTIVMIGFWYMDRYWYHNLLLGAVKQGIFIENKHASTIPEIGLTNAIGLASPHKFLWKWNVHSKHKFRVFYGILIVTLIAISVGLKSPSTKNGSSALIELSSTDSTRIRNKFIHQIDTVITNGDTVVKKIISHKNKISD